MPEELKSLEKYEEQKSLGKYEKQKKLVKKTLPYWKNWKKTERCSTRRRGLSC